MKAVIFDRPGPPLEVLRVAACRRDRQSNPPSPRRRLGPENVDRAYGVCLSPAASAGCRLFLPRDIRRLFLCCHPVLGRGLIKAQPQPD